MQTKEKAALREKLIEERAALVREIEGKIQEINFLACLRDSSAENQANNDLKKLTKKLENIDYQLRKLN